MAPNPNVDIHIQKTQKHKHFPQGGTQQTQSHYAQNTEFISMQGKASP